tara:strand:+ start:1157 stop:1294 length:138 start_codon:yes stop_codon:yes gene_type:complete
MSEEREMKTYTLTIIMDAVDEDDFVDAVLEMNHGELKQHVECEEE